MPDEPTGLIVGIEDGYRHYRGAESYTVDPNTDLLTLYNSASRAIASFPREEWTLVEKAGQGRTA